MLPLMSCGAQTPIPNPLIDYPKFLKDAQLAEAIRNDHRLTEEQFLKAMYESGVVLLDARSAAA